MNAIKPEKKNLTADLLAGLTFAVVNIPTAMAHALMAAVNPVFGTYTLIFGMPVGAIFTSSVFMNISTTSAMAVAAGSVLVGYSGESRTQALVVLVILVGVIQLILGILKQGSLIRFVPNSVMVGFANGVAVLIILGQLSDLTGYESAYSNKVAQTLDMLLHISEISFQSLAIGTLTILLVLLLNNTRLRKVAAILGLVVAALIVQALQWTNIELIQDIASFPTALPRPVMPDLRLVIPLLVPALSITLVGLVQGAAVSQSFPNPDGKFPDTSRDFFGQGLANLVTGFFQGIPAGGSMSGTSLNINSGAKSRWTNIFAGVFVAVIILAFAQAVGFIPMPALAGLVLLAGFQSLQIPAAITVYQTGKVPAIGMALTFGLTLTIPLQYAVLVGVAFAVLLNAIRQSNQVKIIQVVPVPDGLPLEAPPPAELPSNQITILMIFGSVFFAASQTIEEAFPSTDNTDHAVVILGLRGHAEIGSTFINSLWRYADSLKARNSRLMLVGIDQDVHRKLLNTGFVQALGEENLFLATPQLGGPLNEALVEARKWIAQTPEIRIHLA